MGVFVAPADGGRKALVVGHDRARRPGPLPRLPLLRVEGPPFGTFVDDHVVEDETTVLAHDLRAGIVPHEGGTGAFRALGCDLYLSHLIGPPPTEQEHPYETGIISPFVPTPHRFLCHSSA